MSDLIKAQHTPQFNWYTRWISLGANDMPDNLIKEGLKQTDQNKISFEKGAKEITGHVMPDQARFGPDFFHAFTLPNFKSKILTRLPDQARFGPDYFHAFTPPDFNSKILTRLSYTQKEVGPLLFNLKGQCFQDVGLTE
jgi:hypothetical protein